jgi:signal transduction histidine kinase
MDQQVPQTILHLALQAMITERCKRAYVHDLRNGLQGIYGSTEVVKRLLTASGSPAVSVSEKSIEMMRRSLASYEESLRSTCDHLMPEPLEKTAVCVDKLLRNLAAFLNGDAAAHGVSLRIAGDPGINVVVNPHALRLTLLSLLVDAIDTMPNGGELQLEARLSGALVVIDITAMPISGTVRRDLTNAWQLDLSASPSYAGLVFHVVRNLVQADAGSIELTARDEGTKVSIRYPAALTT